MIIVLISVSGIYKKIYTTVLRAKQLSIHVSGYCTLWTGDSGTESVLWEQTSCNVLKVFRISHSTVIYTGTKQHQLKIQNFLAWNQAISFILD